MDAIQAWWSSEEGVLFTDPVYGHRIGLCYQGGSIKKYCLVLNGVRLEDMTLFLAKLGHAKHEWDDESEIKYVVAFFQSANKSVKLFLDLHHGHYSSKAFQGRLCAATT